MTNEPIITIVKDYVDGRYILHAWPCCKHKELNTFFMNMTLDLTKAIRMKEQYAHR